PMRVRFVAPLSSEESPSTTMDKTPRAVIPGSRLFNTLFSLPRTGKNFARSLGPTQSGSPPVGRCAFVR
ncbi:MAG: hypothetical protein WAM44_16660, partial [Chthoniobacterales bacterium]